MKKLLSHHLNNQGEEKDNSRNGYLKKTVQSEQGEMELSIPRDRQGKFEPGLVPEHERRLSELEKETLALYARGIRGMTPTENYPDKPSHCYYVSGR
jgi:transposase-like protein